MFCFAINYASNVIISIYREQRSALYCLKFLLKFFFVTDLTYCKVFTKLRYGNALKFFRLGFPIFNCSVINQKTNEMALIVTLLNPQLASSNQALYPFKKI